MCALQAIVLSLSCSTVNSFGVGGSPAAFLMTSSSEESNRSPLAHTTNHRRRQLLRVGAGGMFSGLPFFGSDNNNEAQAANDKKKKLGSSGPTGEVVKVVKGMKHKRLGSSDIFVSELGLGTQRWVSTDFNAPDKELCYEFMDEAILKRGVNLIDTAEQYPIPSGGRASEGDTERVIGSWIKDRKVPRSDVVIATKITGGSNITPRNIRKVR